MEKAYRWWDDGERCGGQDIEIDLYTGDNDDGDDNDGDDDSDNDGDNSINGCING